MHLRSFAVVIASVFILNKNSFAQTVPTAASVMKEGLQLASKENKKLFIMFHASWCGWCHKMDSSMNDKSVKKYFTDNYIIRHLVVKESENKKNLENPGAQSMLFKYHGNDSGIPFWLIFDKEGNLLADSKIRKPSQGAADGDNIGCPATEDEVNYFIEILKKTSSLNDDALNAIKKVFRRNEE